MISMSCNLQLWQAHVLELQLESEYLESFLIKTETLLRKKEYQVGLKLIDDSLDASEYNSMQDYVLATFSPYWRGRILDYYDGVGSKLGEVLNYDTIKEIDDLTSHIVVELKCSYRALQQEGWIVGKGKPDPGKFLKRTTMSAIRSFFSERFPKVSEPELRATG